MRHATALISNIAAFVVCIAAAMPMPADAALLPISTRTALGADISVDWGVFGSSGALLNTPDQRTVPPVTVVASSSQGQLSRLDEGAGYRGGFTAGERLLTDGGSQSDSFSLRFPTPIMGFATQVDPHYQLGAFTGSVVVYSTSFAPLGTFAFSGTANDAQDGSAPVVGVLSDAADIGRVEFRIDQDRAIGGILPYSGAVAINRFDIRAGTAVPEPAGVALLGMGLLGFAAARRSLYPR